MPTKLTSHFLCTGERVKERRFLQLANRLLKECGMSDHSLSILLVDDEEIRQINSHYRHKNQPTNVLSFPFADGADASLASLPIKELGDVIISVETARREALLYRQSFHERMTWLLVHGLLHLLGFDHERSPGEEEKMQAREQELLKKITNYRRTAMTRLAINVDHVATIRQARGISEPDPVAAAAICELAGAAGIVVHLREDRRHIQDRDVFLLRQTIKSKLNLEMGANKEIIAIALDIKPDLITLVPEKREEVTTEGGLDVIAQRKELEPTIRRLQVAGIRVSLFVDPTLEQVDVAAELGVEMVELHTGRLANAFTEKIQKQELEQLRAAARAASESNMQVNAGHGINYKNIALIHQIPCLSELNIGHAIVSRAMWVGLENAVKEMLAAMANYPE